MEVSEADDPEIMAAIDQIGQAEEAARARSEGKPDAADEDRASLVSLPKDPVYIADADFIAAGGSSGDSIRPETDRNQSTVSLSELTTRSVMLAELSESFGQAASASFAKLETNALRDCHAMLSQGRWPDDPSRTHALLCLVMLTLDPDHYKDDKLPDDKKLINAKLKHLSKGLHNLLISKKFADKPKVQSIAESLRANYPFTGSDASPLPGPPVTLVSSPPTKKRR